MGTVTGAAGVGGRSYLTAEPGARWARLPRSLAPPPEASHRGRACAALCLSLRAGQGVSMWLSFRAAPPPPLPFCVVGEDECATLPGAGPSPTPSEEGGWLGDLTAGSSCPRPWAFGSRPSSVLSPPWCDRTLRAWRGSRSCFPAPTSSTARGAHQLVSPQPAGAQLPQSPGPPRRQGWLRAPRFQRSLWRARKGDARGLERHSVTWSR